MHTMTEAEMEIQHKLVCSSLKGFLNATYNEMVKCFGVPAEPMNKPQEDVIWFGTVNGKPFNIYNWKNGIAYLGKDGIPVEKITRWNVGEHEDETFRAVEKMLKASCPNVGERLYRSVKELVKESGLRREAVHEISLDVEGSVFCG